MNRKYVYYACLLNVLLGSSALAQTQPKKRTSKPVVVPTPVTERIREQPVYKSPPESVEEPLDFNRPYTYVDQMPTLNGQDAVPASIAAIHRSLVVPPAAPDGRVYVRFEVDKEGKVRHPRIAKGLRADVDSAVVAAMRHLPRFVPGKQAGQAVVVSFTLPVTIPVKEQP